MSTLPIFISYQRILQPEITIPKFDLTITPTAMMSQNNFSDKIETAKTRTAGALKVLWTSGGVKESPYTVLNISPAFKNPKKSFDAPKTTKNVSTKDFIKKLEGGFRPSRYKDAGGQSIGYGFYGDTYWKGNTITEELAELVLDGILNEQEKFFSKFDIWKTLNDNQKSALHSYMYNVGQGHFGENTEMGKALRSGDLRAIHDAINITTSLGKRNETLVRRREEERLLFKS